MCSEEKENNMKSLVKPGITNTRASVSTYFMSMKYCLASDTHFISKYSLDQGKIVFLFYSREYLFFE
jgi:hypothetical protein